LFALKETLDKYVPDMSFEMKHSWADLPKLSHLELHFPPSLLMTGFLASTSQSDGLVQLSTLSALTQLHITEWEVDEASLKAWVAGLKNLQVREWGFRCTIASTKVFS
jgi:hypothetical protein